MIHLSGRPKHSIYAELEAVHSYMLAVYDAKKEAAEDVRRAQEMEYYLRMFKTIGNSQTENPSVIIGELEKQGMREIIEMVGQRLGIGSYNLFRNQHFWYKDTSVARWGADDVFEAELAAFLDVAADRATGKINSDTGVEIIGQLPGNISVELMKELSNQGQSIINKQFIGSEVIQQPKFRSAKVDVTGYSSAFQISSEIKPQWQRFIQLFTGANFTLKNYSSNSGLQTIHLGNTNITKSILGGLSAIGIQPKEAVHVYYHSLAYQHESEVSGHLFHIRFAYELTGGGLYDESGHELSAADFFIYNDPVSDNIWVRSTKDMINNILYYTGNTANNINSNVVVLKQSFV